MNSDDSKLLEDDVLDEIIEEFESISESQDGMITYSQIFNFDDFRDIDKEQNLIKRKKSKTILKKKSKKMKLTNKSWKKK